MENECKVLVNTKQGLRQLDPGEIKIIASNLNNVNMIKKVLLSGRPSVILNWLTAASKKVKDIHDVSAEENKIRMFEAMLGCSLADIFVEINGRRLQLSPSSATTLWTVRYVKEIIIENQYNLSTKSVKGKVVIDCGANIGMFALFAAALGASKVYSFEPIPDTFRLLERNIEKNSLEGIVIPINMAVGDKKGAATFFYFHEGDVGASQSGGTSGAKPVEVPVIPIDAFCESRKVASDGGIGFIKMDVEGAEEQALKGATETIKAYKPILSFSAYHKPTDKTRLPEVVRSIRPDYKITLNSFAEEDFYCE